MDVIGGIGTFAAGAGPKFGGRRLSNEMGMNERRKVLFTRLLSNVSVQKGSELAEHLGDE